MNKITVTLETTNHQPQPEPSQQENEQATVMLRKIFRSLRKLQQNTLVQKHLTPQEQIEQPHELNTPVIVVEVNCESQVQQDVFAALQAFYRSDRSYQDILRLADEIKLIGLQEYSKQSEK